MDTLTKFLFSCVQASEKVALMVLDNPDIAKLVNDNGWTLAHEAAFHYESAALEVLKNPEIYQLAMDNGNTVAGEAAGHKLAALEIFKNPEIFGKLTIKKGESVLQAAANTLSE